MARRGICRSSRIGIISFHLSNPCSYYPHHYRRLSGSLGSKLDPGRNFDQSPSDPYDLEGLLYPAWHRPLLDCRLRLIQTMKIQKNLPAASHRSVRFFCSLARLFPAILLAHPGHYHPVETDEFDFMRATFFHSHRLPGSRDRRGRQLSALASFSFIGKSGVRIAAAIAALGSLSLLPIL